MSTLTLSEKKEDLEIEVFGSVYPPTEDSFLLAKHAPTLKGRILDMCTGSGIAALTNAKTNPRNEVIGVDINPEAVRCATKNAKANKIKNASFFVSDLFDKVEGKFDGILCNPPYLPSEEFDPETGITVSFNDGLRPDGDSAEAALISGKDGREFTDRFIDECRAHLEDGGKVLLLQSSLNDIGLTIARLEAKGFKARVMGKESFFFEEIFILEFSCKSSR